MQRTQALQRTLGLMEGFPAPGCVAGGWAVDLFLGKVTREHGDVDIAIFRDDQRAVHDHFRGWQVRKVVRGQLWSGLRTSGSSGRCTKSTCAPRKAAGAWSFSLTSGAGTYGCFAATRR